MVVVVVVVVVVVQLLPLLPPFALGQPTPPVRRRRFLHAGVQPDSAQSREMVLGHAVTLVHCLCELHRPHVQAHPHLLRRLDAVSGRWPPPVHVLALLRDAAWPGVALGSAAGGPSAGLPLPWFEGCFAASAQAVVQLLAVDERRCVPVAGVPLFSKQVRAVVWCYLFPFFVGPPCLRSSPFRC